MGTRPDNGEPMERKWYTSMELGCISVTAHVPGDDFGHPSTCSASLVRNYWYLNRVVVHGDDRGAGIGKGLLTRLQEALRERWSLEQDIPETRRLVVTPGGYGSDPADLEKFYKACGFKTLSPPPELLMEWTS